MMKIRDLLNKIRWHPDYNFGKIKIWYVNRGKENNIDYLTGNQIKSMGEIFMETDKAIIPYHRILKIEYNGKTIFEKEKVGGGRGRGGGRKKH